MRVWIHAQFVCQTSTPQRTLAFAMLQAQRRPGSQKLLEAQFSPGVKVVASCTDLSGMRPSRLDYDGQALPASNAIMRIRPQPGRLERIVAAAEHRKGTRVVRVHKESELTSAKGRR